MPHPILTAVAAAMTIAAFATPAAAQIFGSGPCNGMVIQNAWIDPVSSKIRAHVANSQGKTVRFRVELRVDGKIAFSPYERVSPGSFMDVDVATTLEVFGKTLQQLQEEPHRAAFVPYDYFIVGGLLSLAECTQS